MDDKDAIMKELQESSQQFQQAIDAIERDQEAYWNSLTKDQQLAVFCAVVRRICKGEIQNQGSYRYVLYNVFEFGPEAYLPAQMAGYLNLHNSIVASDYDQKLLEAFCKMYDIPDSEQKITDFRI